MLGPGLGTVGTSGDEGFVPGSLGTADIIIKALNLLSKFMSLLTAIFKSLEVSLYEVSLIKVQ